ncbi:MAG: hypothetical protein ACI9VI_000113 [Candidatus Azotimanducaceae bacterium]|jgi:hypothetical protein
MAEVGLDPIVHGFVEFTGIRHQKAILRKRSIHPSTVVQNTDAWLPLTIKGLSVVS